MNPDPAFWKGRRVLVTGHTGFKGAWLTLWLQALGARVTGLALPPEDRLAAFEAMATWGDLASAFTDLRDRQGVEAAFGAADPEVVFHLGAQALVRRGYADPIGTFETNVLGTVNVLDSLRCAPTVHAAVVVTSDKVYARQSEPRAFTEDDPLGGEDPYSSSKAAAELAVSAFRHGGLLAGKSVATARAGNVVGGGDRGEDRLLPDVLRSLESGEPIRLRYPEAVRPWQHVLEPVCGYLLLAERLFVSQRDVPSALNFGPEPLSTQRVSELVDLAFALWGGGTWELEPDGQPPEASSLQLASGLARRSLGWKPRLSVRTAVEWTVDWWRAQRAGEDLRKVSAAQIEAYEALSPG